MIESFYVYAHTTVETGQWLFIIDSANFTCICLNARLFHMTLVTVPHTHRTFRDVTPGAIDRYWYVYHVLLDEFRCFSKRYPSYALRKHMCVSEGCGGLGKQWTKTIRCGACYFYAYRLYFINAWHVYEWPKTYTWSGTFILKDGRFYLFLSNTV
jgi:hypothetical protein